MEIGIQVEGMCGANWHRWKRITHAAEELGFATITRSDHFTLPRALETAYDNLELWTSLTWLADNTSRIEFGILVTPFSFRDPVMTAWMAKEVDELSNGRLTLGLGAGWMQREHEMFGYALDTPQGSRHDRFAEGVEVVYRLLRDPEPVSFSGKFYTLREASLLPRPSRQGSPRILIGGSGKKRTLPLAAKYADEWNSSFASPTVFAELNALLDTLLDKQGRPRESVRRSVMTGCVFGKDEAAFRRAREYELHRAAYGDFEDDANIVWGTSATIAERLARYAEAGVQQLVLQWFNLDDIDGLEAFAKAVL